MYNKTEEEIIGSWKGGMGIPVVSICTIVFNHEKYIEEALNGLLMQVTSFPFEILINEDCSTDRTKGIIELYEQKFPRIIKPIYQEENQYSKGVTINPQFNFSRAKGRFIALCEGDDYWLDPLKLSKQVKVLEDNPECSLSFHDVNIVTSNGMIIRKHSRGRANDKWKTGIIKSEEIVGSTMTIPHTTAIFFRSKYIDLRFFEALGNISGVDYPTTVMACNKGSGYYISDVMSAYRQNDASVSSTRRYGYNKKFIDEIQQTHKDIDNYFEGKFSKEISSHLKGQMMMKYEDELSISIEKRQIIHMFTRLIIMLANSRGSQYSFLDVLWLFKEKIKSTYNITRSKS